MRILSIFALSALALTATAQSYNITGKADEKSEGKMVYLVDHHYSSLHNFGVIDMDRLNFLRGEITNSIRHIYMTAGHDNVCVNI